MRAPIGILMLESRIPRVLGDIGHPGSFSFPVLYHVVPRATPIRVVYEKDRTLLGAFVEGAGILVAAGAKAIGTSCGFLAMFQRELADAVAVPVYTSSLLQVPLLQRSLPPGRRVGVITADARHLTDLHWAGAGVEDRRVPVVGLEEAPEFTRVIFLGKAGIDFDAVEREVVAAARRLVDENPDLGAIVLECANLPPYARAIQAAAGRPVFDVLTLLTLAQRGLERAPFYSDPGSAPVMPGPESLALVGSEGLAAPGR